MAIYIFIVFTFLVLLSLFDVRFFKTLSDFKRFGISYPFNFIFIMMILSFAGVPPLFGFSTKLIVFLSLSKSSQFLFLFGLSIFNFFTLYFYIQNIRYVVSKVENTFTLFENGVSKIRESMLFSSLFMLSINIFGIFMLQDLWVFFSFFTLY